MKKSKSYSNANKGHRYSPGEKLEILEAIKVMTFKEIKVTYGVWPETIRRWQFKEKVEQTAEVGQETAYSGDHPHWEKVVDLWKSRPGMGPGQIRDMLRRQKIKIHVATVRNILLENGYSPPVAKIKELPSRSYEAVRTRELIHMDFKHFYINKTKAYLLLLQDDYSRFLCGHKLTDGEKMDDVIEVFEECVARYGKMNRLMTDGGSAFFCWNGINRFQRLVSDEYGIDQIKASSPRSNGKIESVNKQIEKELWTSNIFVP